MNWKGFGSPRRLILKYYPGIFLEGLKKTMTNLQSEQTLRAEILASELQNTKQEC
jgi:hypothetical protein